MHFHIVITLIYMVSYVNLVHVFICVLDLHMYLSFTIVYDPICRPIFTSLQNWWMIVFLPVPVLLSICLPLLVWPLNFTEKSDCEKIHLVLSVISIIIILAKLLQVIWGYIITLLLLRFVSLCLHLERYWFHITMVLCHWCFILGRPGVLFIRVS